MIDKAGRLFFCLRRTKAKHVSVDGSAGKREKREFYQGQCHL